MDWAKIGKHVFESSEHPIGGLERAAMVQNLAVHMKHYGLRSVGYSDKDLVGPRIRGGPLDPKVTALEQEALDLIALDALGPSRQYNNWPAPDSLFWVEYGIRFGNYLVVVTNWEGKVRIHTLHTSGEPVYWERYAIKGVWWYAQNTGAGIGGKYRVAGTKCTYDDFVAVMARRCGEKIVHHLKREIYGFGL